MSRNTILYELININDPILNTPMIPAFNYFGRSFSKNVLPSSRNCRKNNSPVKKAPVKKRKASFGSKSLLKSFKFVDKKGLSPKKMSSKIIEILKDKENKYHKKVTKLISELARSNDIKLKKNNRLIPKITIFKKLIKQSEKESKKDKKKVEKRRSIVKKIKSEEKIRRPRKLTKGTEFGNCSKKTCKRTPRFGWWDNTQRDYALGCASQQCAAADNIGNNYPYYGNWPPYASVKGNS